MTKKDYETLVTCMTTKNTIDDEMAKDIYIIKNHTPEHLTTILLDIIYDDLSVGLDLGYEIMATALDILAEVDFDDLPRFDAFELEQDMASVYTAERLGYINVSNQSEISDVMRDYDAEDIATAAAIWYDDKVKNTAMTLRNKILAA